MDYLGGAPLGGRTREEIVERLMEQAAEAAAIRLDNKSVALIERVLSVSGPAQKSVAAIRSLLKSNGIALDGPLDAMETRIAALAKLGLAEKRVSFAARFGRNMEYYTGFVFELWSRDSEGPRAGRGRRALRHAAADARREDGYSGRRLRHSRRARAGGAPRHGSAVTWPRPL